MSEHTKEPWMVADMTEWLTIGGVDIGAVCRIKNEVSGKPLSEEDRANARRIVACVNACAGISTETLEAEGLPPTLSADSETIRQQQAEIDRLTEQRDRLLKALGDLSFECFGGGVGTCQPSVKTYNDTFAVLDEIRKGIS